MTHYKFLAQVSDDHWVDSLFIKPGTFNSARQYLEHIITTPYLKTHLFQFTYKFLFFSEAVEHWYPLATGTLNEILQTYGIYLDSNIVDIET